MEQSSFKIPTEVSRSGAQNNSYIPSGHTTTPALKFGNNVTSPIFPDGGEIRFSTDGEHKPVGLSGETATSRLYVNPDSPINPFETKIDQNGNVGIGSSITGNKDGSVTIHGDFSMRNGEGSTSVISTGGSTGTTTSTGFMYSTPELIDTIVTPEAIELVYKRHLLIWNNVGTPMPEVYKVVYSRFDGSEKIVMGNYVAPSAESYYFD